MNIKQFMLEYKVLTHRVARIQEIMFLGSTHWRRCWRKANYERHGSLRLFDDYGNYRNPVIHTPSMTKVYVRNNLPAGSTLHQGEKGGIFYDKEQYEKWTSKARKRKWYHNFSNLYTVIQGKNSQEIIEAVFELLNEYNAFRSDTIAKHARDYMNLVIQDAKRVKNEDKS